MSDKNASRACVLVVEDYDDFRDTLSALLTLKGYSVETAADGQEAMRIMRRGSGLPDLVITDLRMPHDGWALRRDMLADDALARIPAIVLSSSDVRGSEHELQAVAYMEKPVRLADLIELVEKHCG